jgi:P2 family phage contractile tail tube protein
MGVETNQVSNANVYLNGASLIGQVEEVTLPVLKNKGQEHKALGLLGTLVLPSGFDKLEAKFKFNSFYPTTYRQLANQYRSQDVQVRASLESHDGDDDFTQVPVVIYLRGYFNETPLGAFKQHDNVELEMSMNVTYCKLVIDGEDIFEFDTLANIYKVDGEDLTAEYRANIGA